MTDMSFPKTFVINLDHRTDRWAAIEQTCKAAGICPVRVPAVQTSPGWRGGVISHLQCIRLAKEEALPWLLILEDDATFSPAAIERFRTLLPYLWQHRREWERFNGGPGFVPHPNIEFRVKLLCRNPPLAYANGFQSHFNLIHSGAYDMILQWDIELDGAMDEFYVELETRFRTIFSSVATYPHISVQRTSYSDILLREGDYAQNFLWAEQKLRECFNAPSRDEMRNRVRQLSAMIGARQMTNVNQWFWREPNAPCDVVLVHDVTVPPAMTVAIDTVVSPQGWRIHIFRRDGGNMDQLCELLRSLGIPFLEGYRLQYPILFLYEDTNETLASHLQLIIAKLGSAAGTSPSDN